MNAVFDAAYAADPGAGRSRALFGPGGDRVPDGFGGIDLGEGRASVIAGWSPDETSWLTERVRVWDEAVHWRRVEPNTHPDSGAWRRVD